MSRLPRPRLRGGCFEDPGREAGVSSLEWLGAALVAGVKTFKGGSGQIRAQEFAGKNSATVTSYHYFPLADRVEVEAMTTYITATGKAERAKSVAETGRHLDECVPDAPLVTTTTGYNATAHCGEIQVDIYVPPSTTPLQLLTPPGQLKKMFTVRLAE